MFDNAAKIARKVEEYRSRTDAELRKTLRFTAVMSSDSAVSRNAELYNSLIVSNEAARQVLNERS